MYPDDVITDANGHVHILWEWAYGGGQPLRHLGSYLRFNPGNGLFFNAAGQQVTVPAKTNSPVLYQPLGPGEQSTTVANEPGVQSAKLALHPETLRPVVVYRYREVLNGPFLVKLAEWDGAQWQRSTVYGGSYDTTAGIDVSTYGNSVRVYYAKANTLTAEQAFVSSRASGGAWQEVSLLPGVRVERLSIIRRLNVDYMYLCAPDEHALHYGTRAW